MRITRWTPYNDFNSLQSTLNRVFQDFNRGSDELTTSGSFVPAVDIYEDQNGITLKMEVPGVSEQDINISLENNTLTVSGERKFEKNEKEENFHRIERRYGSFTRSFSLPNTVDAEKVNAGYENGILSIQLGKKAEAKPKQIKISVNPSNAQQKEIKGAGQAA
jgi:HSP20 family protein